MVRDNSLDDNYTSREDTIRDVGNYTRALDFDATTLHNYFFLYKPRSGVLRPGEPHRRDHRFSLYLRLCPRQHRWLHRRHRSNYHGHQSLRHAARCYARCYAQLLHL